MNNPITIESIIMIVGFAITILTFTKSQKKDLREDEKERTELNQKLDFSCNQIGEISRSLEKITEKFDNFTQIQSRHDEQLKTILKTMDAHEKRILHLEEKCRTIDRVILPPE